MQGSVSSPELLCSVPTSAVYAEADLSPYDGAYLGQSFCLKVDGNLLVDVAALRAAIGELHQAGKKAYLTTPVVPNGPDFKAVRRAITAAAEEGIDGVEVHDMGVLRVIKTEFPGLKVHTGHFANVYHVETARALASVGADRISPSYELTLDEKSDFTPVLKEGTELEVPIAGKLPIGMAHSCLLCLSFPSRVEVPCHQQCADRRQLEFNNEDWQMRCAGTAMLMAEDLVMIEHLGKLASEGYSALRLETSVESGEKISALGFEYRAALDDAVAGRPFDKSHLEAVSALAEDGICNGWYFGDSGRVYVEMAEHMMEGAG